MKNLLLFLIFFIPGIFLMGQDKAGTEEGTITYVTPQNVYVQFKSTATINKGDTLFIQKADNFQPVAVVKDLSSISCVCIPLQGIRLAVSDKIYHVTKKAIPSVKEEPVPAPVVLPPTQPVDTLGTKSTPLKPKTQQIHGFLSAASYSDFSNHSETNTQRMRYTFSLNAKNIGNTKLSAECYMSYLQNNVTWSEISKNFYTGLKVYNFALNYEFSKMATLWLGRRINPKLSNMGANDGVQFELRFKPVTVGIIAGFRPDYSDYGFNSSLFQAGGFVYNEYANRHGLMQSTLAFVEQTNSWKTDRRFLYLQHANSLVKNLFFFGTAEFDLYKKVLNTQDSTYKGVSSPWLSNLYLSLNYRPVRWLSMTVSYSARQNVIYYETYKSYLDKLLDTEMLQGYMFQVTVRPVKYLSVGVNAGYRSQNKDPKPSRNVYGYVTYSQIPGIGISATVSATWIETSYINGKFYGIGISRDLVQGKLYLGLDYRYVDYRFYNAEFSELQNIGQASLTWRIIKKLSFSIYYEGTFEKQYNFNRIYAQLNFCF